MISAPMAQISSVIAEGWHIYVPNKETGEIEQRPDYARTQAAMMSVIFVLLCVWTAFGDEAKGTHFELAGVAGDAGHVDREKLVEDGKALAEQAEQAELAESTETNSSTGGSVVGGEGTKEKS